MSESIVVESLVYTGAGLGHLKNGKTVFVPGALPLDEVEIEITSEQARYAEGSVLRLIRASEHRIEAPCEYAELCGGCRWQTLVYSEQLVYKERFVVDALKRIGHIENAEELVAPIVGSGKTWHYRNKVEFSIHDRLSVDSGTASRLASSDKARIHLTMHESGSLEQVAIARCLLLAERLFEAPGKIAGILNYALSGEETAPYRVGLRCSSVTSSSELALYSTPSGMRRGFMAKLFHEYHPFDSIVRVLTRNDTAERKAVKTEVLSGQGHWLEKLAGIIFRISAASFFQVNTPQAEAMVNRLLDLIDPHDRIVYDLYSGAGTFTLPLALAKAQVTAIEMAASSLRDLKRNLKSANLDSLVEIIAGDVERELNHLSGADIIVLDPPRSGLRRGVIDSLLRINAAEIVYVSCDPQTLARDSALLTAGGYHLVGAYPFDLFPQTYHVETIAHFSRSKSFS